MHHLLVKLSSQLMRIPPIRFAAALFLISVSHITGCTELEKTKTDSYFAGTAASRKYELRWSNGKFPRSLDPARASAPPETDVVRAIFEGLTELDPRTLLERPAAAEYWTASDDFREWTFEIRPTAKWSNGEPVTSCLILAGQVEGDEIITLEGISKNRELDTLQKTFLVSGAVQCGFCTPSMILSAKALLAKNPHPTREEIRRALSGNLCRCTGYSKIITAVEMAIGK